MSSRSLMISCSAGGCRVSRRRRRLPPIVVVEFMTPSRLNFSGSTKFPCAATNSILRDDDKS
ncbi:unnamed protein product, partial [Nesidiocoris tenuis]